MNEKTPDQTPVPDQAPRRRWTAGRITLAVSLTLNLLIIGMVAGALSRGGGPLMAGDPDDRRGPLREIGNAPFVRALEQDDRRALAAAVRNEDAQLSRNRGELRRRFQALVAALRADPYDSDAVQALFDDQRTAAQTHQRTGERLILERIEGMTAAERAAYADRLDAALRKGRRDKGRERDRDGARDRN